MLKLNLGCGFRKYPGFLNVDISPGVDPDLVVDLSRDTWPWEKSSVSHVKFEFSLEQMGNLKEDLFFVLRELYRVCAHDAHVELVFAHPRHDQFFLNPLCVHRLSAPFLQTLSLQSNLQMIGSGEHYACMAMTLGVDFSVTRVKYLLEERVGKALDNQQITDPEVREKMTLENNICAAVEVDLKVVKMHEARKS